MRDGYSLSDSSLTITFSIFLGQNVRVCYPNLANILGAVLRVCINTILSQLRKMVILLIISHCKISPLPTIQISRVCIVGNCWQWANFTMGPTGQYHDFAELRQKVC